VGLLADVHAHSKEVNRCRIVVIREKLPPDEAAELDTVVMDKTIPCAWIIKALNARGLRLSDKPLGRHRARACSCFRED